MEATEFNFHFEEEASPLEASGELHVFDIRLQVGNQPIVKNLFHLFRLKKEAMPPDMLVLYRDKDLYSVLHAIGTVSQGAKIAELVYEAEMVENTAQTIDLLPKTQFQEWLKGGVNAQLSLSANGNISADIPQNLAALATFDYIDLGGGMQLKTQVGGGISGQFSFSFRFPVVQSMGISSNKCTWILQPEKDKPLNGDQLLMQIVAVPKGTKTLKYLIHAEITADKGIWWKNKTLRTELIEIVINL